MASSSSRRPSNPHEGGLRAKLSRSNGFCKKIPLRTKYMIHLMTVGSSTITIGPNCGTLNSGTLYSGTLYSGTSFFCFYRSSNLGLLLAPFPCPFPCHFSCHFSCRLSLVRLSPLSPCNCPLVIVPLSLFLSLSPPLVPSPCPLPLSPPLVSSPCPLPLSPPLVSSPPLVMEWAAVAQW